MMNDTINRQNALKIICFLEAKNDKANVFSDDFDNISRTKSMIAINNLPSAQSEPAIPLQWIEAQIEWLKSLDDAFSTLTAGQISAMVNKWKDEQYGCSNIKSKDKI